jgi:hypothetical protein
MGYPETTASGACTRTAIRVRKKGVVYIGEKPAETSALLKLGTSLPEAESLAAQAPARFQVGKGGWVTVRLAPGETLEDGLMERWIDEAWRMAAPKTVLKLLEG